MTKLLLLSIALAGCSPAEVSSTPVHPSPRPMISHSGSVEVLYRAPARPHVDVSELLVADSGDYAAETQSLAAKASAIGCDGVVLGAIRETADGRSVMASCIVYTDADQVPVSWNVPRH